MFDDDALMRTYLVMASRLGRERRIARLSNGHAHLRMAFVQALIAPIGQHQKGRMKQGSTVSKHTQVVMATRPKRRAQDRLVGLVHYKLYLKCVLLFLATVACSALFFGLSIGLSVTSITTACHCTSERTKAFLPGR